MRPGEDRRRLGITRTAVRPNQHEWVRIIYPSTTIHLSGKGLSQICWLCVPACVSNVRRPQQV